MALVARLERCNLALVTEGELDRFVDQRKRSEQWAEEVAQLNQVFDSCHVEE